MPSPASVAAQSSVSATPGNLAQVLLAHRRHHAGDLKRQGRVDLRPAGEDDARLAIDFGKVDIVIETAAAESVRQLARAVRGEHDARDGAGVDRAELGDAHLEVGEELEQEGLELLVGPVDLVDEQDRRRLAADGGKERPLEQILLREDVLLDAVGVLAGALARLDGEKLALVVPLVEGGVLVEALVALQADQLARVDGGERLGDLGLADAGLAFEEERPLEEIHQPQRHGQLAVGDIADLGQALGDVLAGRVIRSSWRGAPLPDAGGPFLLTSASAVRVGKPARQWYWCPRVSRERPLQVRVGTLSTSAMPPSHPYLCSPSFSATVQVRQWSWGMAMWVEPRKRKASLTALAKHGTPPTFGLSPTPLAPIG